MKTRILVALLGLAACTPADGAGSAPGERPTSYGLGTAATPEQIAAIDIDVNPTGAGLPPGEGTAATGAVVYAQKCAVCHGPKGEGIEKNPKLIGREPPPGFVFATDFKAPKTVGNYWAYSTTLYDYIHRTMPMNAPGSLTPTEVYGVVAFLLSENGIIPATKSIDAKTLATVKMPAQSHLVPDNRTGGQTFR
jgi:cytochrome c